MFVYVCVVDRLGFDSKLCSEFKTGTWDRANTVVSVRVGSFQLLSVKQASRDLCEGMPRCAKVFEDM